MGFSSGSSSNNSSGSSYGYATSLAQSMQSAWQPQAAALTGMYANAASLAARQGKQVPGAANALIGQTMPGAQYGLSQMQQFANPNSALAAQQTANLANTVGQQFNQQILPGIRSGAGIGGNMGGSREALAKGVAAGDAARAISEGATNFYANAYNQAQAAAAQLPSMAGQVFNLGMTPFQAAWAPLQSLGAALGIGPTTLNRTQAMSEQQNWQQQMASGKESKFGFQLW